MTPLAIALLGCRPEPVAFCENPSLRYDYAPEERFTTFPDDHWTVSDPGTSTGLRLDFDREDPRLAGFSANYSNWFDFLSTLDGFGTGAGVVLQLIGPPGEFDVVLAALTPEGPVLQDPELTFTDHGQTVILKPRAPLPPGTRVVAVLLTDPAAEDCINPGPELKALLDPSADDPPTMAARFQEDLAALGIAPERVGAMTVFTTQSTQQQSLDVAADVASRDFALEGFTCSDEASWRFCSGALEVLDYRDEEGVVPSGPVEARSSLDLPVWVWLPLGEGPWPVTLCGHGLGGDKGQCGAIQPRAAEMGLAVVAVDAVEHGEHPGRTEADLDIIEPLMIFAIQMDPPGLHGLRLRDNFRQSAWEKLQVIRAIQLGADLDGDGNIDLDPERIGYAGVSLGAIMGPELMALTDAVQAGWLAVGGARVTQIIQDSVTFSVLIDLMRPPEMDEGDVDRAFPMLQTMMDPGDPLTWAPLVQRDRQDGGSVPDLYLGLALEDEIVPNSTNNLLAQSLGLPGVGREVWPIHGVSFAPGDVEANGPGGATGGVVQLATVHEGGEERAAEHDNVHESDEGMAALEAFFGPGLIDGERAVILDPGQ